LNASRPLQFCSKNLHSKKKSHVEVKNREDYYTSDWMIWTPNAFRVDERSQPCPVNTMSSIMSPGNDLKNIINLKEC
jgi:hypothetical protein